MQVRRKNLYNNKSLNSKQNTTEHQIKGRDFDCIMKMG